MVVLESDGFGESLDDLFRVVVMEGSRVAEAWLRANQEMKRQASSADRAVAEAAARRLESSALISQAKLAPVMGESWWDRATPKMAATKYAEAKSWDGVDGRFDPYVERIEEQAKERFDLSPEELGKLDVTTGVDKNGEVKAMSVEDAQEIARAKAPAWYKVHEALEGDLTEVARAGESARLIEDMTALQRDGKLDTSSARDEWARFAKGAEFFRPKRDGETVSSYLESRRTAVNELWDQTASVRESVARVPEDASGAAKREARPMEKAEVEALTKSHAPGWYKTGLDNWRTQVQMADDMGDQRRESAVVEGGHAKAMTQLRDTGRFDHPFVETVRSRSEAGRREGADGAKVVTQEDRERFGGVPAEKAGKGRESASEGPKGPREGEARSGPGEGQEEARKERRNESLVERAARKMGWDSKERREAREEELHATPGVTPEGRTGVMTADRNSAVQRGEVHERKGKGVNHAVRNKSKGRSQGQEHDRGR